MDTLETPYRRLSTPRAKRFPWRKIQEPQHSKYQCDYPGRRVAIGWGSYSTKLDHRLTKAVRRIMVVIMDSNQ